MSVPVEEVELAASTTEYATQVAGRKHRSELPHLRLVSPLRPERASRGLFAVIVSVLLAFGLVVMLLLNTSVAQTAFVVTELKIQQRDLARAEAALTQALAAAAAPPALEAKARSLGMVPSSRPVFLTVPGGKVRGNARPVPGNRARTANLSGSLTATLLDAPNASSNAANVDLESPTVQRRQVGDGAVLVEPGASLDEATEQARKNEQRQRNRQNDDGAELVSPVGLASDGVATSGEESP
jgi:hypothetical protein